MIYPTITVIITGFLVGLRLLQSPRTALWGNRLSAFCMMLALLVTWIELKPAAVTVVLLCLAGGGVLGVALGRRVRMIRMPQTVALLNGFGGAASALVAGIAAAGSVSSSGAGALLFWSSAGFALAIGTLTFSGSVVAALKLQGWLTGKALVLPGHEAVLRLLLLGGIVLVAANVAAGGKHVSCFLPLLAIVFGLCGLFMALRIGGADMPVIISFLNSLSGVAAAVCGLAVENLLLVATGALVGVAGLILTRMMCQAMNRNLAAVLGGFAFKSGLEPGPDTVTERAGIGKGGLPRLPEEQLPELLRKAQKVMIVPGYGMAVAQAQRAVTELIHACEARGKEVQIAIHPVAGRMPGHMTVLLAETGIDYDKLVEMEEANCEFCRADLVIVVGACDVVNPAAGTAAGTPIYGMPVLKAEQAPAVVVCNLDAKPGYSGVENLLYRMPHVIPVWGDASETVPRLLAMLG